MTHTIPKSIFGILTWHLKRGQQVCLAKKFMVLLSSSLSWKVVCVNKFLFRLTRALSLFLSSRWDSWGNSNFLGSMPPNGIKKGDSQVSLEYLHSYKDCSTRAHKVCTLSGITFPWWKYSEYDLKKKKDLFSCKLQFARNLIDSKMH